STSRRAWIAPKRRETPDAWGRGGPAPPAIASAGETRFPPRTPTLESRASRGVAEPGKARLCRKKPEPSSRRPGPLEEDLLAAGQVERGAGRVAGLVRCDPRDHVPDVLGGSHAPERDRARVLRDHLLDVAPRGGGRLPEAGSHHVGHHRS